MELEVGQRTGSVVELTSCRGMLCLKLGRSLRWGWIIWTRIQVTPRVFLLQIQHGPCSSWLVPEKRSDFHPPFLVLGFRSHTHWVPHAKGHTDWRELGNEKKRNRLANFLSLHCRWAKQHQFLPQRHGITWNSRCQRARWPWRWHRGAWEQLGSSHCGDVGARGKGALPTEKLDLRRHPSIWQADEGSLQGWPQHLWDSARRRRLDPWCIGEFRVFRRWGRGFLAKGAGGGWSREVPAAGAEKENGKGTWETTQDRGVLLLPDLVLLHSTVLGQPGANDVFGPRRRGLRSAAVLVPGAGAGWPALHQLHRSDWWSQIFRSTTESVGILWQLRLFLPGLHYCSHSHREVCDGWILVDRAGSWPAVLLHVYSHV